MMMFTPLFWLVPLIAFIYSSVGFGGATGYLVVMSLFGIPQHVMASSALTLNILVAGISFTSFYRAGHLRHALLKPFLITSVPAAFLGGYLKINDQVYTILLYFVLTIVAIRLLFSRRCLDDTPSLRPVVPGLALVIGLVIGLLSGMVGIGGGIFLSPIIILLGWGNSKQTSPVAAAFIVLNCLSSILGRIISGVYVLDSFTLSLLPLSILGGLAGSWIGAERLSNINLRRALGTVMSAIVTNFWLTFWK